MYVRVKHTYVDIDIIPPRIHGASQSCLPFHADEERERGN
jgi:hypothetical protein